MSKSVYGFATEEIPFGATVLCRGMRVSLAGPDVANGVAKSLPVWSGKAQSYATGQTVAVEPIEGIGSRDLHALANAPIMDPSRLYLPAGKLSKAEADSREAANVRRIA